MNAIFKKLNFKDQKVLHVINSPGSFKRVLEEMNQHVTVKSSLSGADSVSFFLAFVTRKSEVDTLTQAVVPLLKPEGIFWFAYPKGTSKNYKCDFNRDNGWTMLGELGFEGVRMVAIDQDWTALRFKRAHEIKLMTRSFAMSEEGKKKVASAGPKKRS